MKHWREYFTIVHKLASKQDCLHRLLRSRIPAARASSCGSEDCGAGSDVNTSRCSRRFDEAAARVGPQQPWHSNLGRCVEVAPTLSMFVQNEARARKSRPEC